jgi:hypothetical protein
MQRVQPLLQYPCHDSGLISRLPKTTLLSMVYAHGFNFACDQYTEGFAVSKTDLPPISDKDKPNDASSSSRTMLITMLLLITGLILSSAMMLHYAFDGGEEGGIGFAGLLEQDGTWTGDSGKRPDEDAAGAPAGELTYAPAESAVSRFFSPRDDGTVKWPKLKLTGFGKSTDAEGSFAIINGQQVMVSNYIGEVQLVEIRAHGAVVEYRGERRVLTVDQVR